MRKRPGLILLLACFLASSVRAEPETKPSVGLNKFDLAKQYLGIASGGDGSRAYRRVTEAMGRKAIIDASDLGIGYFRIALTGFAPNAPGQRGDLDLWLRDPAAYWTRIDKMMDDLDRANVQGVFTFVWNTRQFPAMNNETIRDMLVNPESRSVRMLHRYITEFISRYKTRHTTLMYELTNEINLGADLDAVSRCHRTSPKLRCDAIGNYSTEEMISFLDRVSAFIKALDPSRPISAGHATPRANAADLRAHPEWQPNRPKHERDTYQEFEGNLIDINQPADVFSVHLYPGPDSRRFGSTPSEEDDFVDLIKAVADRVGKPLFIGEFGDPERKNAESGSYTTRILDRIVKLGVPFSALWVWQMYDLSTYETGMTKATRYSIDPNTDRAAVNALVKANRLLREAVSEPAFLDSTPPQVVLTWPLECSTIKPGAVLHAAASDAASTPTVEFRLDDKPLSGQLNPPYSLTLPNTALGKGVLVVTALAKDAHGNASQFQTRLVADAMGEKASCEVTE